MVLLLTDVLRYLISGLFVFSSLDKNKNHTVRTTLILSTIYSIVLIVFKVFVIDNPIITLISTLITFVCLLMANNLKNLKFYLTYSLFINCITEYIHFLVFKLFSISREALGVDEINSGKPKNLLISIIIILVLYTIAISLIYIFKRVDPSSIKKFSGYAIFPAFLGIALLIITCLKYCIKYTHSNKLHDLLSVVFVGFIVVYLVFLFSSGIFLNIIEGLTKRKINPAIEESKLSKPEGISGLTFISEELNGEMSCFLSMLREIGMDTGDKKSKQIAYCAVLLNHEENPQETNMISVIYPIVGVILNRQAKTIESNISNAIKTHWTSCTAETLEKIKMNYKKPIPPESGCPSAKEFLLYLTQKYEDKYPKDEIKSDSEYSFFKKYLLNIQN